ncbi:hypothetical protein KGM_212668B, partial [Danaus plexippus plexippus]
EEHK